MKIITQINSESVYETWEQMDNRGIHQELQSKYNPIWFRANIESIDLHNIYIIYAKDWKDHEICIQNDYRLNSAYRNYLLLPNTNTKKQEILERKMAINNEDPRMDLTLFLCAKNIKDGPYVILEGNKRAMALKDLNRIVGTEIYLGISERIESWGYFPPQIS